MPKIKTKRQDILRKREVLSTLEKSKEVGAWLACLIALAWMFGKRINELLQLKREDLEVRDGFLYVRFLVSKKQTRKEEPIPKPYLKRITVNHPGVFYVLGHTLPLQQGDELFPNMSRQLALYYLKKANPSAWFHLFRESLATEMAEHGATEEQLLHWFDWERVDTAHEYVKRGTKLTQELSSREW